MHLAYATSPLNPLVPPSGRVRSREGLQKIYPQNLKKEKQRKEKQTRKNENDQTQYTHRGKLYTFGSTKTPPVTQVSVCTQALNAFQDTSSQRMASRHQLFTPRRMTTMNPSWCLVCKCIITLKLWPTKTKPNPTSLTQATFLNG